MAIFDVEDAPKGGGFGGPIGGGGGGGGPGGTPGFGGGSLGFGGPTLGAGSEAAKLRAMLRKRMLGSRAVPYQQPGGAQPAQPGGVAGLQAMVPGGGSKFGPINTAGMNGTSYALGASPAPSGPPPAPAPAGPPGDLTDRTYNDPRVAPFVGLDLLIKHLGAGNLGPNPSQNILDAIRGEALSNAEAGRSRMELAAQSMGADPASRASYGLQAGLKGQSDVSQALNSSVARQYEDRQKFAQQLLQQMMQAVYNERAATAGRGGGGDMSEIVRQAGAIGAAWAGKP